MSVFLSLRLSSSAIGRRLIEWNVLAIINSNSLTSTTLFLIVPTISLLDNYTQGSRIHAFLWYIDEILSICYHIYLDNWLCLLPKWNYGKYPQRQKSAILNPKVWIQTGHTWGWMGAWSWKGLTNSFVVKLSHISKFTAKKAMKSKKAMQNAKFTEKKAMKKACNHQHVYLNYFRINLYPKLHGEI